MKKNMNKVKDLMTKGALGLAIAGMTSLYACEQRSGDHSETDANTEESTELGGSKTGSTGTDAYGMDTSRGTPNTRGMDEVGTTSGTGAGGTTYGGNSDTTNTGTSPAQSGLKDQKDNKNH